MEGERGREGGREREREITCKMKRKYLHRGTHTYVYYINIVSKSLSFDKNLKSKH